jgi:hypothetical protein
VEPSVGLILVNPVTSGLALLCNKDLYTFYFGYIGENIRIKSGHFKKQNTHMSGHNIFPNGWPFSLRQKITPDTIMPS